jgi:hypothetical protein
VTADRWVVHVPVTAHDLTRARLLARVVARTLAHLRPAVDLGDTTVSPEDDQGVHHRVFCDRLLAPGRRCGLPDGHAQSCATRGRP